MNKRKLPLFTVIMFVVLLMLSVYSIFVGVIDLDIKSILGGDVYQLKILFVSRLPRLLAILCTGVGIGVAGLIMCVHLWMGK